MKKLLVGFGVFVCCGVFGQTTAYWQFQDGTVGAVADKLTNSVNPSALLGTAKLAGSGSKPMFAADVPGPKIYSARYRGTLLNADNRSSLRFFNSQAPFQPGTNYCTTTDGSYVEVTNDPAICQTNFTVEFFVKVNRISQWGLLIGKQRTASRGAGASWCMDSESDGRAKVRFDSQDAASTVNGSGFNQTTASKQIADGAWHHMALAYSWTNRTYTYYVDYQVVGSGTVTSNMQYTTEPLFFGKGAGSARVFDGWMDEIRYTPSVIGPNDFLCTNSVQNTDTLYWNFESQPFVCKGLTMMNAATNRVSGGTTYPVSVPAVWSNETLRISEGKQTKSYWNTNNLRSVFFVADNNGAGGQLVIPGRHQPTNFTVEAMVKVRTATSYPLIVGKMREYNSPTWSLSISGGNLRTRFDCYTNSTVDPGSLPVAQRPLGFNWLVQTTAAIAPGTWYHVAFSYSNQVVRMYRNYQQVATATTPYPIAMTEGDITVGNGAGEGAFDGWIDEVRITPQVLPPSLFLYTVHRDSTLIRLW